MTLDSSLDVDVEADSVAFTFRVRNVGDDARDLSFRNGKTADIAVREGETEVWRWSDGGMFTQALRTVTLGPGETITHEGRWENPKSGEYTVEATLAATNVMVEENTRFQV